MKHEGKIVLTLILMFIAAQFIGLAVIDATVQQEVQIIEGVEENITVSDVPFDLGPQDIKEEETGDYFKAILIAFVVAIFIFFLLSKLKTSLIIQAWFTIVVFLTVMFAVYGLLKFAIGQDFTLLNEPFKLTFYWALSLLAAIPLTFFKTIRKNIVVHNITELLIYPGLAAIFVPILRPWSIVLLLIIISVYDMWAVWKSKFMIKLAKYQIQNLKLFTGFFIPYMQEADKKKFEKIRKIRPKSKALRMLKKKKIKISLALLGGGDVAFPLLFAGVLLKFGGGLSPAIWVIAGATAGLLWLFIYSKKGKFYPAMPFITIGSLIGWGISFLL